MSAAAASDSECRDNAILSEDVTSWVSAIEAYVKETRPISLDLSNKKIGENEITSVLKILLHSEVTELNLDGNELSENYKNIFESLKKTKIKKLTLRYNDLDRSVHYMALLGLLNDSEVVDLGDFEFSFRELNIINGDGQFLDFLHKSCITRLNLRLNDYNVSPLSLLGPLTAQLPHIPLSFLHLDGQYHDWDTDIFASLFSKLPYSQIKNLDLSSIQIDSVCWTALSQNLANSRLEKLTLFGSKIDDATLDILAQGLANSSIKELNLSHNKVSGLNSFGLYLKKSKVRVLGLGSNPIRHSQMFNLPDFLKGSHVEELNLGNCGLSDELCAKIVQSLAHTKLTKLDLQFNDLGVRSISVFAAVLQHTSLEDVDLSCIDLPAEAFDILSGCIEQSKLKCVRFERIEENAAIPCSKFLTATKNSSLLSIHLHNLTYFSPDHFTQMLVSSTFTHLDFTFSDLRDIFPNFVSNLKYTCIAHLNLTKCYIGDENVNLLAEHLKETKIVELILEENNLTSKGAGVLAVCCPHTRLTHLNLNNNNIENDGFEILAQHLAGSLISVHIHHNSGDRIPVVDKVLWENRTASHKIVATFTQVFPDKANLCFHQCIQDRNVSDFLEQCLQFYKTIVGRPQPAVVNILLQGESTSFLKEKLVALVDNFPAQLVDFISTWVEADVSQHVQFAVRADELQLVQIVELLLLLRPLYTIDEAEGILHPLVYGLLVKYKQPICNEAVEPRGVVKIIEYFTKHSDLEGAADILSLLRNKTTT